MDARASRAARWTRRRLIQVLALVPARAWAQRRSRRPSERIRYADPATEFLVERLTDPSHSAFLPAVHGRAFARKGDFLLFSSDVAGSWQVYRLEERTAETEQLTEAAALDPLTVTLLAEEDAFCYFDGPVLHRVSLRNLKDRPVYRTPEGWRREGNIALTHDGKEVLLVERRGDRSALRSVRTGNGRAVTILERSGRIEDPLPRPRRDHVLYRYGGGLWMVSRRTRSEFPLRIDPGEVLQAHWSPEGNSVLYLHRPHDKGRLSAIREYDPETHSDRLVAPTSQFACFNFNRDASVFVGASANVASPYLLLLLRATRREFTLCEHAARRPELVQPLFSPDSRRVYFQSDRDGRPALYRMNVEKLVEPTDS